MAESPPKTVLVVDDEEDVRKFLSMALKEAGFNVVTANDGFEALDQVKKQKPDLISLDLVMPKRSGGQVLPRSDQEQRVGQNPDHNRYRPRPR